METTKFAQGAFCWTDMNTDDVQKAMHFYSEVLGWSYKPSPMGEKDYYWMSQVGDRHVNGMAQASAERRGGAPPSWNVYFAVDSVDETIAKATALGAKVAMPAMDVFESGRMAFLIDPTGAAFGLWQAKAHPGFGRLQERGAACWVELMSSNSDAALGFYSKVLGWGSKTHDMGAGQMYTEISTAGETNTFGGVMQIDEKMAAMGVPSHWGVYWSVDDVDATVKTATGLGAKVVVPAMDIPNVGRFAQMTDPCGGHFTVFTSAKK